MEENGSAATVSADDFAALEGKVLQTVELIKREREARAAAEGERDRVQSELAAMREELRSQAESASTAKRELETAHRELETLQRERDGVRKRVEHMLQSMDELL